MKQFFLSATQINMTSDNQIREESFVVLSVMNEILVHIKSRRLEPTAFLLDPSDRCWSWLTALRCRYYKPLIIR